MKHAKLSPSSSNCWIKCPGSIKLSETVPPPLDSPYAMEGTAAHKLAELCVKSGKPAEEHKGKFISVESNDKGDPKTFEVTDEMIEAVDIYVSEATVAEGAKRLIEAELDLSFVVKDCFGHADCINYYPKVKLLEVLDLKYGKGILVDPEWNTQAMCYGVGALKLFPEAEQVRLTIVQPRAYHKDGPVRRWTTTKKVLSGWAVGVLKNAADIASKPNAPFKAGEHCRFCPALAICKEQRENALAIAKTDFDNPVLPDPERLSNDDMTRVMALAPRFVAWASSVQAYAQSQLEMGQEVLGYKLVAKRSNRKWVDMKKATLKVSSYLREAAFEKKLITVAKAEKAIKKQGNSPEAILDGLWTKPDAGVIIAPVDDARAAVGPTAIEDFLEDEGFLQ